MKNVLENIEVDMDNIEKYYQESALNCLANLLGLN